MYDKAKDKIIDENIEKCLITENNTVNVHNNSNIIKKNYLLEEIEDNKFQNLLYKIIEDKDCTNKLMNENLLKRNLMENIIKENEISQNDPFQEIDNNIDNDLDRTITSHSAEDVNLIHELNEFEDVKVNYEKHSELIKDDNTIIKAYLQNNDKQSLLEEITDNNAKSLIDTNTDKILLLEQIKDIVGKPVMIKEQNIQIKKNMQNVEIIAILPKNIRKINIVLDLDNTLVFACTDNHSHLIKECNKEYKTYSIDNSDNEIKKYSIQNSDKNIFDLKIPFEGRSIKYRIQIRKYVVEMLIKLSSFCNFYIYTLGRTAYANEVLKLLKQISKLNLLIIANVEFKEMISAKTSDHQHLPKSLKRYYLRFLLDFLTTSNSLITV